VKNQLKNVRAAITSGGKENAQAAAKQFISTIDKA
jgi:ribosomal protein S20